MVFYSGSFSHSCVVFPKTTHKMLSKSLWKTRLWFLCLLCFMEQYMSRLKAQAKSEQSVSFSNLNKDGGKTLLTSLNLLCYWILRLQIPKIHHRFLLNCLLVSIKIRTTRCYSLNTIAFLETSTFFQTIEQSHWNPRIVVKYQSERNHKNQSKVTPCVDCVVITD